MPDIPVTVTTTAGGPATGNVTTGNTTNTPTLTGTGTLTVAPAATATDEPLGDTGKSALVKERQKVKDAEAAMAVLAGKLKELEDRDKSEADKVAERLALFETAAHTAQARLIRYEVAVEQGVPANLIVFVNGTDRETVEASVTKVLAAFKASQPTGPRPDPSQGQVGAPISLGTQIAAAEKAGNTREVIRLRTSQLLQQQQQT